jgi:hypothetical protein
MKNTKKMALALITTGALVMTTVGSSFAAAGDVAASAKVTGAAFGQPTLASTTATLGTASLTGEGDVDTAAADLPSVTVVDATGLGQGWSLKIQASAFALVGGTYAIPGANFKVTAISEAAALTGVAPLNGKTGYPLAADGRSFFTANAGTGMGKSKVTAQAKLTVPVDAYAGDYQGTVTITAVNGIS